MANLEFDFLKLKFYVLLNCIGLDFSKLSSMLKLNFQKIKFRKEAT